MARIAVVIPALNEAQRLPHCLRSVGELAPAEVVVADGGSTDGTVELARTWGANVLTTPRGRTRQMNAGAAATSAEVLLFLHADCVLPANARAALEAVLADPLVGCGAFRHRIDSPRPALRVIAAADNFRAGWLHRPYGDQAIFVRREHFLAVGGYAEVDILEDVLLMQRLRRRTRFRLAEAVVLTDARRWEQRGVLRTTLLNQLVLLGAALRVPNERLARLYSGPVRSESAAPETRQSR